MGKKKYNELDAAQVTVSRLFAHANPSTGKLDRAPISQLVALFTAQTPVKTYANETALLANTDLVVGYIALNAATGAFYLYNGPTASDINNYTLMNPGGTGTVQSVTGDGVDNTDPANPVLSFPDASDIEFTPAGNLAATDVQAALEELDSEKSDALITTRTEIASHTLDSTDLASINAGKELVIEMNLTGTANNLTVPPNASVAFPIGTFITVKQQGTGVTTIVAGSGVTITPPAGGNLISPGQGQPMILRKTGTNTWDLYNGNAAEAITKVDDTNVTLTLNGSPSTSVLSPVEFELGWTGILAVDRGGVGANNTTQTYTPTLTNTANLAASTAYECMYSRIGNVVTVSGRVDIDPTTTATLTTLGISLPIASDFTTANQASGTAAASAVADAPASIFSDATNNRLTLQYVCTDVTNHAMYFTCTYLVV